MLYNICADFVDTIEDAELNTFNKFSNSIQNLADTDQSTVTYLLRAAVSDCDDGTLSVRATLAMVKAVRNDMYSRKENCDTVRQDAILVEVLYAIRELAS